MVCLELATPVAKTCAAPEAARAINNLARPVSLFFGSKTSCLGTIVPQTVPQRRPLFLKCLTPQRACTTDSLAPKPSFVLDAAAWLMVQSKATGDRS